MLTSDQRKSMLTSLGKGFGGLQNKVPAPTQTTQSPTMTQPKPATVPAPTTKTSSVSTLSAPSGNTVPAPPQQPKSTFSAPQYNDWLTKQNETFSNLEKLVNTPFQYNSETDPGYLAQRQLANQRAGVATQNALETANDRGIMGSSMNISQLGQIQQNAEQEAMAYIPEYRNQAYSQHQNQLANAGNLLRQSMDLRNQQFGESVTEADITGSYLPAGAQQLVNQIQSLKSQAEVKGLPNTEVKALSAQADQMRAQLQAMGVDVSKLGSDTSLANSAAGQRTLPGQQFDQSVSDSNRNYDRGVYESDRSFGAQEAQREWDNNFQQGQFDWNKAQQTWENAFKEKDFEQQMKEAAASRGLQWANLGQRQKEFVADQAFREKQFAYEQEQDLANENDISPLVDQFSSMYVSRNPSTGEIGVTNQGALRNAIIARGLPDEQTDQLLIYFGLPTG